MAANSGSSQLGSQLDAQMLGRFEHQPAGRFGLGVFEQFGPQVVAVDVMIEHRLMGRRRANDVGHRSQLGPGTGVEDQQHLDGGQFGRFHVGAERPQFFLRIDKGQIRRRGLAIDDR